MDDKTNSPLYGVRITVKLDYPRGSKTATTTPVDDKDELVFMMSELLTKKALNEIRYNQWLDKGMPSNSKMSLNGKSS